jgi:hypothetical protein
MDMYQKFYGVVLALVVAVIVGTFFFYEKDGGGVVTDPVSYTYDAQQIDLLKQQTRLLEQQNALLTELVEKDK